jgi:hypothetical protein
MIPKAHDPEKWSPVSGKGRAYEKQAASLIQRS